MKYAAFPAPIGASTCVFHLLTGLFVRHRPLDGAHYGPPNAGTPRNAPVSYFYQKSPKKLIILDLILISKNAGRIADSTANRVGGYPLVE